MNRWNRWSTWAASLAVATCWAHAAGGPDPRRDRVVEVTEQVMPSVVNIATEEIVEYRDPFAEMFRDFWGPYYRNRPRSTRFSLGSGVIVDEEGYVLTNLHVVQRATKVWVQLPDGREFEAKPLVGTTRRDVALLKLVTPKKEKFRAARFAQDDDLLLGETVLALGNPFGLGGSVSRGILSSKNRRPPLETEALDIADWLQTDAAINPGSSGGPLVNLRGEVIGLNVAVYREGQGIGFAIPGKQIAEALADILTPEVRAGLWFGARLRESPGSVRVLSVQSGSPAARAGLRADDQLLQIGSQSPRNLIHASALLSEPGIQTVSLTLERSGERRTVAVKLLTLADLIRQRTGLSLQEIDEDIAQQFGLRAGQGLLVADVEKGSPADAVQLQAGHVLLGFGEQSTPDLRSAAEVVAPLNKGDSLALTVLAQQRRGPFTRLGQSTITLRVR